MFSSMSEVWEMREGTIFEYLKQEVGHTAYYKLFTLIIWLIQPMNDDTLTYTPGTFSLPQPNPHETNPANS